MTLYVNRKYFQAISEFLPKSLRSHSNSTYPTFVINRGNPYDASLELLSQVKERFKMGRYSVVFILGMKVPVCYPGHMYHILRPQFHLQ